MTNARGEMPHPGVRFPPPFLFVGGFLSGWWLSRKVPLPLLPGSAEQAGSIAGLVIGALGLALMLWGLATFRSYRTGIIPNHPATRIVRTGPYRVTRNPMYTGMTLAYVGGVLLLADAWPLLLLPIVLFLLVRLVIAREERYLASAFPDDYDAYCRQVRRWL
jgi:protein-S-isoprenylcysteine O-methyltransferase Ste14